MSRDEWVAAAAEALRGHLHLGTSGRYIVDFGLNEEDLAEALADALLPEVAETRIEFGVRWDDAPDRVHHSQGDEATLPITHTIVGGVVVSRVVTVGPWKVAETREVIAQGDASAVVDPSATASPVGAQIEETGKCDNCDRPATRIVGEFGQHLACDECAEELDR